MQTTLERAFDLARSGRFATLNEIMKLLNQEGYAASQIQGPLLKRQLTGLIKAASGAVRRPKTRLASARFYVKVAGSKNVLRSSTANRRPWKRASASLGPRHPLHALRQRQDDVAVALARTAHGLQSIKDRVWQHDQIAALAVGASVTLRPFH
jgi:hypothetical protein